MAKRRTVVHWELTRHSGETTGLGQCGYHGEVTKDKDKVTCKFCRKMIRKQYPKYRRR